jgi:nucleotide-binding universal stress UspA family protein
MSFKDILVHLDGGDGDPTTLAAALALGRRFGARLVGLFARDETQAAALVARMPSTRLREAASQAEAGFTAQCADAGLPHRWLVLPSIGRTDLLNEVLYCAYTTDLIVVGQDAAQGCAVADDFVEEIILKSGRPVLMVPRSHDGIIGSRVAIGWRAGREAARATHDAMPFIEGAEHVSVVAIGPRAAPPASLPPVTVIQHLAAHGAPAQCDQIEVEGLSVMDSLLSRAYDVDSNLLVVGAHGGYVLPLGRGSATRHLLRHASLPVLFSH